jgi:hypothetical protein
MNKLVHSLHSNRNYWPMLFLALLFFFVACASTHRERMLEEIADAPVAEMESEALEAQFTAERLSAEELKAFESRAIQKLEDFSDYVNLLADPGLDSVFRQQAIRQALVLFVDEHTEVVMDSKRESIIDVLERFNDDQQQHSLYEIQDIEIKDHLQPTPDRQYAGKLSFQQHFSMENRLTVSRQAQVIVRKVLKRFGDQEEWVWEVLIADIE